MCPFKSLVGHFTNLKGFNLLTDNTLKKLIQDVLVRCLVNTFDHNLNWLNVLKIWSDNVG